MRGSVEHARGDEAAVVVPRLVIGLYGDRPGRADAWADTEVRLPEGRWCEELTGRPERGGARRLAEILAGFPVALLVRDSA